MYNKGNLTDKIKNLQRREGSGLTGGPTVITVALKMGETQEYEKKVDYDGLTSL